MSRLAWSIVAGAGLLVAVSCTDSPTPVTSPPSVSPSLNVGGMPNGAAGENPHRHFFAIRADSAAKGGSHGGHGGGGGGGGSTNTGIFYHGGPVIYSPKVAAIYWSGSTIYNGGPTPGNAGAGSTDGSNVGYFLNHLGGSSYWNINTTYTDGGGAVSNSLEYSQYWADNANPPAAGQNVSDAAVQQEVVSSFSQNGGPFTYDASTLYIVFSGEGVNLGGGFGTSYCAYHGYFTWNGNIVKYAVMPYVATYPSACTAGTGISPKSDFPAAAEVNVVAHETEETATDEDLNAWYDHRGYENADKCAWKFGSTHNGSTGAYNEAIGGVDWLIQMNWVNAGSGGCLQGY